MASGPFSYNIIIAPGRMYPRIDVSQYNFYDGEIES